MFLVHITNPKSFVFNFWGSLHMGAVLFLGSGGPEIPEYPERPEGKESPERPKE